MNGPIAEMLATNLEDSSSQVSSLLNARLNFVDRLLMVSNVKTEQPETSDGNNKGDAVTVKAEKHSDTNNGNNKGDTDEHRSLFL